MSAFQPGEIVDIEIKGARVVGVGDAGLGPYLRIAVTVNGHEGVSGVLVAADGVTVTRVAPAEWPPQPGDLWRGLNDRLWFAIDDPDSRGGVRLISEQGTVLIDAALGSGAGCVLVRRGETADETPDDPVCQVLGRIHCADPDCSCKTDDGEDG